MQVRYVDVVRTGPSFSVGTNAAQLKARSINQSLYGLVSSFAEVMRHVLELLQKTLDGIEVRIPHRLPPGAFPKYVQRVGAVSLTGRAGAHIGSATTSVFESVWRLYAARYNCLVPSGGFGV